jgi:2-oxo-4-hydroxy-4-carboxy-5-ureidoimidazoline decarboxylase
MTTGSPDDEHGLPGRAAGRSAEEMVTELDRRLANDEDRERAEVTEQLAQITRLRLQTLLAG